MTSGIAQNGDAGVRMGSAVAGSHNHTPGVVVKGGIPPVGEGGGGAPHTEVLGAQTLETAQLPWLRRALSPLSLPLQPAGLFLLVQQAQTA